ncbi:Pvc16 family protein, partial [Persephonella sp.]
FLPEDEYEITFNPPNKEWYSKLSGNKIFVNIFLYDIQESLQLRSNEWTLEKKVDGSFTKEKPVIRLDLYYVITVWSPDTSDGTFEEHQVMGLIFSNLFRYSKIPEKFYQGDLKKIKPAVEIPIFTATKDAFREQGIGQFWSTMELPWKPAIYLTVTAPITTDYRIEGKLVRTKISRIGHIGLRNLIKFINPFRSPFSKESTKIELLDYESKSYFLNRWRRKGYRTLYLDGVENISSGDWLVIVDGDKTETVKVLYKINNSRKIILRDKLRFSHRKNTEVKKVTLKQVLSLDLVRDIYEEDQSVVIEGNDIDKLNTGDILLFKDGSSEDTVIVKTLTEEKVAEDGETYVNIGGVVTNNAENRSNLIGAKVELYDSSDRLQKEAITDINGRFIFTDLKGKSFKLKVSKSGYRSEVITIQDVKKISFDDLNILLKPEG